MADAYVFPLHVELEETKTPRLKIKLVKYFQSKKSNGGDCEVEYENGSRTAVLRFRTEEDQQNVLAKGAHQINLEEGVLKMKVFSSTDNKSKQETQSGDLKKKPDAAVNKESRAAEAVKEAEDKDEEAAEEGPCSKSSVLGNVTEKLSQEFLEMLVENVMNIDPDSPTDSQCFTLEIIPIISSAVVTFQTGKENTEFLTKCPQNRTFKKKGLSVQPLEITDQVIVEEIRNFSEDFLRLYFENAGGDVENIILNAAEESAIINFKDFTAVEKIMKKKHYIKKEQIKVYPFYKSLGTALYGEDKPLLKLPAAISETIDEAVWRYLDDNPSAAETILGDMEKYFCNVNLQQPTVYLNPDSDLLHQKDAKTLIEEWADTATSAFAQALSKFKSLQLHLESEVWEESEEKVTEMLIDEEVIVVTDKDSGILSVAGPADDVNSLERTLSEVVNEILKNYQRKKSSITQDIKVPPSLFHILCQDGLQDKLQQVYPELQISLREESPDLIVTGLGEEILAAKNIIYDQMLTLKRQKLEMDKFVLDMLKDEEQEELTHALLTSNKINAAFEINAQRVQLLAVSDSDLNDAADLLGHLLISQYIDVEDSNVLEKPEWQHLISQLENANNELSRKIRIQTKDQQVVVSGHRDVVTRVGRKLDDYLKQNTQVEDIVVIKPNSIIEYIKKHNTSWLEEVADKVVVSYKKEAICLCGSRVNVAECKTLIEDFISSFFFEILKISKPGLREFFKDKEAMYVNSLLSETGCLVQLVDEDDDDEDDDEPTIVYQIQTSDGVEIAVCKGDMCSYPVHAVVNASNPNLKHSGGLAGALLRAAGSQLQDECDQIINLTGPLRPGDTVITGAGGRLSCQNIIHAVGPNFDPAKPQKALAQLKRAVKGSLDLAEKHDCDSIALPAISRNQGFPLPLCAITVIKAVKEHCEDKYDDNILTKIHLVNNDNSTVQAMEAAVRQEFGDHGIVPPRHTPPQAIKVSPMRPVGSDPNCLGEVMTKEGVGVTLMKGNIEETTTEIIVNTVFEDLVLNRGAVSSAILSAAGPKLQQLVHAENSVATVGEIIVTDGCNLKSKQVFHAAAPHWDNGQGTAEKILTGIFKECLGKAEDTGLTSISFPAIGTGNLGFPKDFAASLMFDEIIAFSSKKQPKHLKKIMVVIYPADTQTAQAFSDQMKKKFPSAVSAPADQVPPMIGPFSKIVSSSTMHETQMGGVTIQVVTGDITKETTDVIVNSSNETFTLKSGVSKAILNAAGQAVEAESKNMGTQPNPGVIMTQPGNLKCKKILHLIGQNDPAKINKAVKDALLMCVKNSYTSVSFPAIGTGQGNVQAKQVADAMLDAVIEVLSQNTSSSLKTVRVVIFQAPMLKEFCSSMQQREDPEPKVKVGLFGKIGSKLKSLFSSENSDKIEKEEDFIIEALEVDPACFHICGDSQVAVETAKQWIDDLISKEYTSMNIMDNSILTFSDADYQCIVDFQKSKGVSIRTESTKAQAAFTIEGLSKNVLEASYEIHVMLKQAREEQLAATVADWQYQQQDLHFHSFDSKTNFQLEHALDKKQQDVKITFQGDDFIVTLPEGPATDSQGRTLSIRRIDKLKGEDFPSNWIPMPPNTTCCTVAVQAGTPDYNEVLSLFQVSCKHTVLKIERIQNPILWKSIQIKKRDMEQRNGHQNNERRLFHGTDHATMATINEDGFNRSYAGKNAACYGNGTYFAVNASYSANNTYSKPNAQGEKCMYLCRVLTGDYTLGKQDMIVPPAKGPVSVQKYDSVVDNMTKPNMFVIFHDIQAYPEYLITFK